MLEAALAAGLNLPHSCRSGHCASCKARLISGEIPLSEGAHGGADCRRSRAGLRAALSGAAPIRPRRSKRASLVNASDAEIKTLPCRIASFAATGAGCDAGVPAPAGGRAASVSGWPVSRRAAGRRAATQLLHRQPATRRRAQIELHVRRVPGGLIHRCACSSSLQCRVAAEDRGADRPVRLSAERSAGVDGCGRHRLRADQVDAPARAGARLDAPVSRCSGALGADIDLYDEAWLLELARRYPSQLEVTTVLSDVSPEQLRDVGE